jgi:nuclear pore complex protein Nup98-Nup96
MYLLRPVAETFPSLNHAVQLTYKLLYLPVLKSEIRAHLQTLPLDYSVLNALEELHPDELRLILDHVNQQNGTIVSVQRADDLEEVTQLGSLKLRSFFCVVRKPATPHPQDKGAPFASQPRSGVGPAVSQPGFGVAPAVPQPGTTSALPSGNHPTTSLNVSLGRSGAFVPYQEKDGQYGRAVYEAITANPCYQSYSFEELRLQDLQAGRKEPPTQGGPTAARPLSLNSRLPDWFKPKWDTPGGSSRITAATPGGLFSGLLGARTTNNVGGASSGGGQTSTVFDAPLNTNTSTSGSGFGANAAQPGSTSNGARSLLGLSSATNSHPPGLFAASAKNNNTSTAGSGFSTNAAQPGSTTKGADQLYYPSKTTSTSGHPSGLFAASVKNNNASTASSGFTTNAAQPGSTSKGADQLFGPSKTTSTSGQPSGLFGASVKANNTATTSGLFGNNASQLGQPLSGTNAGRPSGLFAPAAARADTNTPTTGGLFASNAGRPVNLFRVSNPGASTTGSLFTKPGPATSSSGGQSLFGAAPTRDASGHSGSSGNSSGISGTLNNSQGQPANSSVLFQQAINARGLKLPSSETQPPPQVNTSAESAQPKHNQDNSGEAAPKPAP